MGTAKIRFATKEYAQQAISQYEGQQLDGMPLAFELMPSKSVSSDIVSRLGKRLDDRLGKRLDDRIGRRIDDRLGAKESRSSRDGRITANKARLNARPVSLKALDDDMDNYMSNNSVTKRQIVDYSKIDMK